MKKAILFSALMLCVLLGAWAISPVFVDLDEKSDVPELVADKGPVKSVALESKSSITSFSIAEDRHDFGQVEMGDTARKTFYILNTGSQDLKFTQPPKPSCGCTLTDYSKDPVAPGEKAFVEVIYPAKKPGIFRKSVTLRMNTDPAQKILSFSGEVIE